MIRLLACAFLAITTAASAQTAERCPTLPADSGLIWSYREGPDFDLCYAIQADSSDTAFGMYFGNHPSFQPDEAVRVDDGIVGGREVVWYEKDDDALARQTLLVLDPEHDLVAHIWVMGETAEELEERLAVLERLTFD